MLGSSNSIACANIMLNAAVAESLKIYADRLENVDNFEEALHQMIKKTIKDHKRIIFNGNGYDDAWIKEATEVRGLSNLKTTPDCMPKILERKNSDMLIAQGVMTEAEIKSRCEIMLENYNKTIKIEALTMLDMAKREIIPAIEKYVGDLAKECLKKQKVVPELSCKYDKDVIVKLSSMADEAYEKVGVLQESVCKLNTITDVTETSYMIRDVILQQMAELRVVCDEAETLMPKSYWPFPTYADLLFSV
jgi:glutamine synthetase